MAAFSDSEDESFVELGKPLPFVEGDGKTKPITLQDAPQRSTKDAKGRPRFHGAFTGGFSAGYFNSVGTKEGWAPSTFVSSRQQKQEFSQQQNPEDFMDDEDLGEHGIAPRQFATSEAFSSDAQSRKRTAEVLMSTRDSILPVSTAMADLIVPERLPVGIRLLRKMGWKEGQGIGPRVGRKKKKKKRKENKAPAGVKIYSCPLPPPRSDGEDDESDLSDIDLQNVTFAPKDVTPVSLTSKDNVHGLGYHGIDPRSALPGTHVSVFEAPAVRSSKSKKGIRGQGFGVGALEDDDADIYTTDSLSNYDQSMELDDSEQLFGWTAPGARRGKGKTDAPKVPVSYVGKLLEGFSLSAKPLPQKKVFGAPALPRGFQPFHRFKKTAQQLAQEAIGETPPATATGSRQHKMNAVERGWMLGETPIASSVFDLIPKDDIKKMEAVKDAAKMVASRFQSAGTVSEDNSSSTTTTAVVLTPDPPDQGSQQGAAQTPAPAGEKADPTAVSVGGLDVKPFHKDPAKQGRYESYLALAKKGVKEPYNEVTPGHMTEWERQREREEFSKAVTLYRPLCNMMASRFTRGTFIDDASQQTSALVEVEIEQSEQAKAAEMKMYGRLTREEVEWHPHNLLCKRLNIPNPYPDSDIVGVPGLKRDKFSIFNFLSVPSQASTDSQPSAAQQDAPKARAVTNSLTRELNASKRKKGALSIFSVLEEEERTHRKRLPPPSSSENADSTNDTDHKTAADEDENGEKSDDDDADDGRPTDLFRAIFKNSDSESSSSSGKSDSEESEEEKEEEGGVPEDSKEKEETEKDHGSVPGPESSALNNTGRNSEQPSSSSSQQQSQNQQQPSPTPPDRLPPSPSSPPGPPPPLHPPPTPSSTASTTTQPTRSRKASRWGVGSIFDVLDQSPPRTSETTQPGGEGEGEGGRGKVEERLSPPRPTSPESASGEAELHYGPVLPPPPARGVSSAPTSAVSVDVSFTDDTHRKHKHKHRDQERDSSKHRHKKEKKKKSKHKKEKKKKKKSKHSHHERHKKHSSGSEADSKTDSDS